MIELSTLPLESIIVFSNKMLIFLAALAALIFVHELGHFLVARKVGVIVEKFSIGFGPKIFGINQDKTEFVISAIPLGGYVKMKGEDPDEQLHDTEGSFSSAPVKDRLAIAFAGPAANILFALGIFVVVYLNGVPTMVANVGTVKDLSPAQIGGLQPGDRIIEINKEKIDFWEQLQDTVHKNPETRMEFTIQRNSTQILTLFITPITEKITNLFGEKENVGLIGITPLVQNISFIREGSPADIAGLKVSDKISAIDGKPMRGWEDLKTAAIDKPKKELTFTIQRNGITRKLTLIPKPKKVKNEKGDDIEIGVLGLGMSGEMMLEQYGLLGSIMRAVKETGRLTYLIGLTIKKMIFGSVSAESIGGPILIFQIYGEQAKQGFNELIRLTALISINLGLLNLLPIPVLDGGHIFFFLLEIVKGRPVSQKNRERAQQVGFFILISLMIFAFYNDIMRIIA